LLVVPAKLSGYGSDLAIKIEYLLKIRRVTLKIKRRYSMSNFKKLTHAMWECKYHLVWCSKYRFRILKGELAKSLRDIIKQLCEWKKVEILEGNILIDHIHLVLSFPPKYSISEVVGFLKGKSAIKIFDMHLELKKRYWGRHFWAKGYCVSTVGLNEEEIRKYVRWQLEKDRTIEQLSLWNK
jgi:putative transposase